MLEIHDEKAEIYIMKWHIYDIFMYLMPLCRTADNLLSEGLPWEASNSSDDTAYFQHSLHYWHQPYYLSFFRIYHGVSFRISREKHFLKIKKITRSCFCIPIHPH